MAKHGPYTGVAGWFEDTITPPDDQFRSLAGAFKNRPQPIAPLGYGGHDEWHGSDESGAAGDLCAAAAAVNISCSVHTLMSFHTWPFAARAFTDALAWMAAQIHTPAR